MYFLHIPTNKVDFAVSDVTRKRWSNILDVSGKEIRQYYTSVSSRDTNYESNLRVGNVNLIIIAKDILNDLL